MRFREATAADAAEILRLYKSLLTQEGVTWNEEYPDETCIRDDLAEHGTSSWRRTGASPRRSRPCATRTWRGTPSGMRRCSPR